MANLHVAILTSWDSQGGVATYSARFTDALEDAEVDVTPVPVENNDSANPFKFVDLVSSIPDEVDVVHVQFEAGLFGQLGMSGVGAPAFFLALSRLDLPIVTTFHEVHADHPHRGVLGDYVLRARDFVIERLALLASDVTVVHTSHAKEILRDRHGGNHHIDRMMHPANSDAEPIPKERAKDELGVDGPMLLTFGFVEEKKRYQDVIRVLPNLPNVTYVIAGGYRGSEGRRHADRCRSIAKNLGVNDRVRFTGYVEAEQVPIVFSAADVVVLPYDRVSQSGVVNDALAYERPVVASALPSFEELRDEFSCLVTYEDAESLVSYLSDLLSNSMERRRLRSNANMYTSKVSWSEFAKQSVSIYNEILSSE